MRIKSWAGVTAMSGAFRFFDVCRARTVCAPEDSVEHARASAGTVERFEPICTCHRAAITQSCSRKSSSTFWSRLREWISGSSPACEARGYMRSRPSSTKANVLRQPVERLRQKCAKQTEDGRSATLMFREYLSGALFVE